MLIDPMVQSGKETHMRRTAIVLTLVAAGLLAGGCTRGIKEGIGLATGGKGRTTEIMRPTTPLGMYPNVEVGRFSNSFGGVTPGGFSSALPGKILEHLRGKGLSVGGSGKTLVINGDVIYYETAAASGHLFGPLEEVLANVQLVDKATGKVIGKATCVGRSTTSGTKGPGSKADGLAKAIAEWIAGHSPKKN